MSAALQLHVLIDPALVTDPRRLEELLIQTQDFAPFLEEIGGSLEEEIGAWFLSQGEGTWAELRPSTLRDRARKGFGGEPPLVRSRRLLEALTARGAPGHKFLVSANSITVGAYSDAMVYLNRLAHGSPSANLPARLLVNVRAGFVDLLIERLAAWLGGGPGVQVWADAPLVSF